MSVNMVAQSDAKRKREDSSAAVIASVRRLRDVEAAPRSLAAEIGRAYDAMYEALDALDAHEAECGDDD